jgi:outer membrane biosynthesis protein TonB
MFASLADPAVWRARLAICVALSLAMHASTFLLGRRALPQRVPQDGVLNARLFELPAAAVVPAMAIREPDLPTASGWLPRQPEPPAPAAVEATQPRLQPASEARPATEEPAYVPVRVVTGAMIVNEPVPLPPIRIEGLDPGAYLHREATTKPVDWIEEPKIPPPLLRRGERRRGSLHMLVFVGEDGQVVDAVALDEDAPPALADAARKGLMQTRFEPAEREGRRVKTRVAVQVNFGYD